MTIDRRRLVGLALLWAMTTANVTRAAQEPSAGQSVPLAEREASILDRISAESLRGHVSFLASDLLEGRGTPSRGLDLAAEYIAAQFRRAGLEPIGDDGYFQTARWREAKPPAEGFSGTLHASGMHLPLRLDMVTLRYAERAIPIEKASLVKVSALDEEAQKAIKPGEVKGRVVLFERPDAATIDRSKADEVISRYFRFIDRLADEQAVLVLGIDRKSSRGWGVGLGRLIDPEQGASPGAARRRRGVRVPMLTIQDPEIISRLDALPAGETGASLSLTVPAPVEHEVRLRNVVGLLRGSDPKLRETYVLVTAHYDHLGEWPNLQGDRVFNGANDDASGTASVIELASALASGPSRPARSLVFLTFFGEESGLLGSRYYARHPVVPIAGTVANLNLEQVGRTDDSEGPQVGTAAITGFDYSSVGASLAEAGKRVGIRVFKHPRNSDRFFRASDNYALAELGVPAHTLSVAYLFPDYHKVGDHWEKLDYANMARVDRMVALGLIQIANDAQPPQWNESNPAAKQFVEAGKQQRAAQPGAGR